MPKDVRPVHQGAPARMPTQSVQQLRDRNAADVAQNKLYARVDKADVGLLPRKLGPFVARHDAAQRMDFRAFDAHTQNNGYGLERYVRTV